MSIFKRVKDIAASTFNGWLDKAEDPVKLVDQYLTDMSKEISVAQTAVAKQIAASKQLKQQLNQAQVVVERRQHQAQLAVQAGDDGLALEALAEKKIYDEKVQSLTPLYEQAYAQAESLKTQMQEAQEEYRKMQLKRQELVARANAAKATKSINETISGIGKGNAVRSFERMEQKVMQFEAEAEATQDMSALKSRTLDDKFAELGSSAVTDELAALKAQYGSGGHSTGLSTPVGISTSSEDRELQDELASIKAKMNG